MGTGGALSRQKRMAAGVVSANCLSRSKVESLRLVRVRALNSEQSSLRRTHNLLAKI